jgi:hypothetical protein
VKFSFGDEYDTPDPKVLAQKIGAYARGGNTLLTSPGCLECVVLNVCHGGDFAAELIQQGVPVVIAWETSVDNESATVSSEQVNKVIHLYTLTIYHIRHNSIQVFATGFYGSLREEPVDFNAAFERGKALLEEEVRRRIPV